jgi:serine/threonine-protein kinase greatwall
MKSKLKSDLELYEILGTPDYLAPELILGFPHNEAVDWWALGICLYEYLNGIPPFNDDTPEEIFKKIMSQKPLEFEEPCSLLAQDVIKGLLSYEEKYRYRIPNLKNHEFFKFFNWSDREKNIPPFVPSIIIFS